jgi:hypothetical protein
VQRALHLLFPDQTSKWNFSLSGDIGSKDRKSFDYFIWSYSGPGTPTAFTPLGDIPRYPLVVAFQPPWILSEQDILEFSAAGALSMQAESSSPLLDGKERLWAKVPNPAYYALRAHFYSPRFGTPASVAKLDGSP